MTDFPLSPSKNIGLPFVSPDILEQKHAEEAKFFLASIVESSADSIISINLNGTITSWNKGAEWLYGYAARETIGKPMTMLTLPEDLQQVLANIERVRHSEKVEIYNTVRTHKDGRDLHLEIALSPVKNDRGEVIGASTIARDVTARKRAEANLAFLSELSQDLVQLTNVDETMDALGAKIGAHFRASRCAFGEVVESGQAITVTHEWKRAGVASLKGTCRVADYHGEEFLRACEAGETFVVGDTAADPRINAAQMAELGILALVTVPQMRDGVWAFHLNLCDAAPRNWREDELELLRGVTSRIWTALERARAEEALRAHAEQFRRGIEEAPLPMIMHAEDGQVLQISRAWTELTGYTQEDIPTFGAWLNRAYGPGADTVREHMRGLFAGVLRQLDVELEVTTRAGDARRWAFSASAPGTLRDGRRYIVGMAIDITEQRAAENALRESEERLRLVVENARDYAIFSMDRERVVTSWSAGAQRLLGWTEAEILGQAADVIFTPEDRLEKAPEAEAETALRKGRAIDERWHVRKNGERFWGSGVMMAMRDAAGQNVGLVKIFRDQTEAREAQEALETARQEAVAANLAKDHFLAALSHELRTPLNPVLISATALEADLSLPEETREQLGMMRRNIELEARLIDDLLNTTFVSQGKLQLHQAPADAHALLLHTREIVRGDSQGKSLDLCYDLGAEEHWIMADSARLQQVLWNVIKNAVKFTDAGGRVTVRTRNPSPELIRIEVEDTGIGMSEAALGCIFNPFEQGDLREKFHTFGGLGLGLSISKAIVDLHGAQLRAESGGAGKGSVFTLEWPVFERTAKSVASPIVEESPASSLRLLVVEDDAATLSVMVRLLERDGHKVFPAINMRQALAIIEEQECDLVISDLGLPNGSGIQLMRKIREKHQWPGIALSGFGMEKDFRDTREAGFEAHLIKPVDIKQLRFLIATLGKKEG